MRALVTIIAICAAVFAVPSRADEAPATSPRAVVERGVAAHGGALWLDPGTLVLAGKAEFYDPATGEVHTRADDYRMWREFERGRTVAHGAEGKLRISAKSGERTIFEVGHDGETTWTQDGVMPKAEAEAYWANNFGFGIIRSALDEGFTVKRAPSRDIGGHPIDLIRLIDPQSQETLFGFDQVSGFIRYMAFDSPRGFHERLYDDFMRLPASDGQGGWVQAREVTLLYDGIKSNTVFWREVRVGEPIDPALFAWLGDVQGQGAH